MRYTLMYNQYWLNWKDLIFHTSRMFFLKLKRIKYHTESFVPIYGKIVYGKNYRQYATKSMKFTPNTI